MRGRRDVPATVLKVENVSKNYPGVRALDDVSIDCIAGEVHAVLGENGSGKSTLLKIAAGALKPDSGSVEIGGVRLASADPRLANSLSLATVYQDDSLVRELSVAQNLYLGAPRGIVKFKNIASWAEAQLMPFDLSISVHDLVGNLTPAHRQFVEIVKALLSSPKVLLLDEPTSTLDIAGVRKLTEIIRQLTARGTGVIYVSHRLPEILELADRVTILRDGVHRGTFPVTEDLGERDLVSLMVGRDIQNEYPDKTELHGGEPHLSVRDLNGRNFHGINFDVSTGEVLGFAGADGNGQREALRAIVGLEDGHGRVTCGGKRVRTSSPREAFADGVLYLSADRSGESIFSELGLRKNMTLPQLKIFKRFGLLSARGERDKASQMVADFGVIAASLEQPISGLSGGNQQKAVLARSFRTGAKALLIDEPTQGVDAGARHDIYKAIRDNISNDGSCIINSSDAQELSGLCDRVLVFSRGTIVRELKGGEVTEKNIVSSFLTARDAKQGNSQAGEQSAVGMLSSAFKSLLGGSTTWWLPLVLLAVLTLLVSTYAASQSHVFLKAINIKHIFLAAAPAGLVAMAQLNVLLVRGLDVSVGSLMSVIVVAASFLIAAKASVLSILLGVGACLLIGVAAGFINGLLVRYAKINAVITTIAMLSVLQGVALIGRPTPGGLLSQDFTGLLRIRIGFLPVSVIVLVAIAIIGDMWLHRSRSGLETKAIGFREEAARRNGVRVDWVHIRAYIMAGLLATLAGFFLGSEVGIGHPNVGQTYALTSIAAAVLGGAALSGGRGSFGGALFGAFFFTLMVNIISILGMSASVGIIASGLMTLIAIFLYSGLAEFDRIFRTIARRTANRKILSAK
jgi:ribose transport system ATP-binding protein